MHTDDEVTDAELITRYRAGDDTAASVLFTRHHGPAVRFASGLAGRSSADDLAAEAFTRVLAAIRNGRGPDVAFRAYLMTSVRNAHINSGKRDGKLTWVGDYESIGTLASAADESGLRSESALLAQAFATLPERWQTVLWHTSVEDDSAAEVGRLLGVSPSAVGALAYRAREGLRQAYLAAHVAATDDPSCHDVREKLPAHSRGQLGTRASRAIDEHLDTCPACAMVLADLRSITSDLSALLIPALLGSAGAAIHGRRPRKRSQQQTQTSGNGASGAGSGGRAGFARSALSRTGAVRAVAVVAAAAAASVLIVVVTRSSSAPGGDDAPTAGLGGGEALGLVEQPAPAPIPTPTETPTAPVPDKPLIEPAASARAPAATPKPTPAPEPEPQGTTYDLVLALANVNEAADGMTFDLEVSSPDAASTLVIDVSTAGGWNFSSAPPAGADCSAPSGTTPVQITCDFADPFAGTLSFLLLDTGGTEAFTAALTAADNTDPTPGDAAVSFSSP